MFGFILLFGEEEASNGSVVVRCDCRAGYSNIFTTVTTARTVAPRWQRS